MPHADAEPSPWLLRWAHLIAPGGAVLDLACGFGRHARLLAARAHPVVALDRDREALAALAGTPGIEALQADLEDGSPWPLGERRFAAVVVFNYLHRPLFPRIAAALGEGGVLVYETFAAGNERYGRPSNPHFLLQPAELLDAFSPLLSVVAFEQGGVSRPKPAVIQRLCAIRGGVADAGLENPAAQR
ncbi:MAG: class I SAM-dependent methyltransferase [Burkholderiales bacterium]|nr:class I SAM-dependent methyltransferase [Burkholderiales bacterium]